jgi:single-strand DNA-binding protein
MNKVTLIGRLTKDPEIKLTQSGKKIASFSIAVDDGKDQNGQKISQYFNCSAWEQLAELFEQYIKKGHRVAVIGKLQNRSWDKPDGTKGYATDILIREMEMLTSRAEAESLSASESSNPSIPSSKPNKRETQTVKSESELPEIDVDSISVQMPF